MRLSIALGVITLMGCMNMVTVNADDAAGVTLVADGQPRGAIVLHADASESERWAARELQTHVRTMSGATLPIQTGGEGLVYLGKAAVDADILDNIAELGTDGYAIVTKDGMLGIAGSPVRGTMYGVFTVLHDLGCRWWTPTEQTIPERRTVTVGPTNRRDVPVLEYRDMMYNEMWGEAGQTWAARNRVNGMAWQNTPARFGGRYQFVGNLVHSYNQLMNESGMELKPEMWALVNDQRRPNAQPCLTHPDTLEAMTRSVLKRFEANPQAEFVVVGQNDNNNYCRCENCAAIAEREESQAGHVIAFTNQLIERVQAQRPGARIAAPAYAWSRKPPKHLRPHEDIIIVLCSIEADFNRPLGEATTDVNLAFKADVEGWHAIARTLFIWDYTTNFLNYMMPHPNLDVIVPNVRFFADQGARGYFAQGSHTGGGSEFYGLRMWLLARAMWDPAVDADALRDEFLRGYYGPAADVIGRYIQLTHQPGRDDPAMRMGIYHAMNQPWVASSIIADAEVLLREAARLAGDDDGPWASRVRHARMPVWYVLAKRGPENATWAAVEAKIDAPLTMAEVHAGLRRVATERNFTRLAEGFAAEPWLNWLEDYTKQVMADGPPRPAEASAAVGRVFQSGHMDPHFARGEWLVRADGASDGWAMRSPTHAWLVRHHFVAHDDFEPGKTYRLMARVRGEGVAEGAEGVLANIGSHGGDRLSIRRSLDAALLADGQWHVVEVGTLQPRAGQGLWIALTPEADRAKHIAAVQLDCFWLEPRE